MGRALYAVSLIPRVFLIAVMVILLTDMMLGVFFRYVVGQPLAWTEEVGNLALVWLTFVGGAIGVNRAAHFSIHLLVEHLSPAGQRALNTLVAVVIMALGLVLVPTSWRLMIASSTSQLPGLGIGVGFQYASAFVGALLFALYAGCLALETARGTSGVSND